MPEAGDPRVKAQPNKRLPWYFLAILAFFMLPITFLLEKCKPIQVPAFLKSLASIMLLGYAWSYLVSSSGWWTFNPATMLGWEAILHMPLEELLFYPLGGSLSILVYIAWSGQDCDQARAGKSYLLILGGITLCVLLAVLVYLRQNGKIPWYVLSQVVLFNGLSIGLWFRASSRVLARPAALTVAVLTVIGFFWNWLAFTQTWWAYHATLGWMFPPQVPVDDWNFFIFAPLAAASLYEFFSRRSGSD